MKSPEQRLNELVGPSKASLVASSNIGMSGMYQITVRRHGFITHQTPWFDNLILNQGLDILGTSSSVASSATGVFNYCQVGTGTSVPTATQTKLDNYLANTSSTVFVSNTSSGAPLYKRTAITNYVFGQGAIIGTISEIGIGWATTDKLFSRALITDSGGAPTPLTLTSIDQVTVSYGLTYVPDLGVGSGSVVLDGVTYPYTTQMTDILNWASSGVRLSSQYFSPSYPFLGFNFAGYLYLAQAGQALPANPLTTMPAYQEYRSTSTGASGYVPTTYEYTPGSYTALATFKLLVNQGNMTGGIQFITVSTSIQQQHSTTKFIWYFTNPIPKTNLYELSLTMSTSWNNAP
jgi:hypothetical protein